MSETDPIIDLRPALAGRSTRPAPDGATQISGTAGRTSPRPAAFDRKELAEILRVYGRFVAAGEWRDYAIDMGRDTAVFSIFRRSSEWPIYRIEKTPKMARRQGAYSVVAASGLILKRGHELARVLAVFDKGLRLVER